MNKFNIYYIFYFLSLFFFFLIKTNWYKIFSTLPENKYSDALKKWYFESKKEILDLNNPKTFCQKIQWLKIFDINHLKTKLADKILVKK